VVAKFIRKRWLEAIIVSCLLCLGFWQLGHGAYIPAKAWVAQELMHQAWRRARDGDQQARPWPWADTWPVAKLSAKGGDIELIVLAGESGRTLAFGPGHLSASVLPGEQGNSVIAGHRDTHFQFLQLLNVGESLLFEMPDGKRHLYRISYLDVLDSRRGSIVLDTDQPMLSLITCYPFNSPRAGGPMRYVVTAEMIY
jgi:sortase A